jgi:hypothetical protein
MGKEKREIKLKTRKTVVVVNIIIIIIKEKKIKKIF